MEATTVDPECTRIHQFCVQEIQNTPERYSCKSTPDHFFDGAIISFDDAVVLVGSTCIK